MNNNLTRKEILAKLKDGEITPDKAYMLLQNLNANQPNRRNDLSGSAVLYFQNQWQSSNLEPRLDSSATVILLFDLDEALQKALRNYQPGIRVILVKQGPDFGDLGDDTYQIHSGASRDYQKLFDALAQKKIFPELIIHWWSKAWAPANFKSEASIDQLLENGIYSLFYLCQTMLESKAKPPERIFYLYSGGNSALTPFQAAVSGFANTLRAENPKFLCSVLEISDELSRPELADLLQKEFQAPFETEVKYESGRRLMKTLTEIPAAKIGAADNGLIDQGVYLLTGGLGGLGFIFAEYLARKVKAKLVLAGRTGLDEAMAKKIQNLEQLGAEVLYCQADVSKKTEVFKVLEQAKLRFHQVNGILHCAGVIRDSFILAKNREEIAQVLAAKIYGTIWLDEATRKENLGFLILFSSLAVLGNPGQSDYAYANSFMDGFAGWRNNLVRAGKRSGRTLAINWPLWEAGGMDIDPQTKQNLAERFGISPILPENGLKAFEAILGFNGAQLFVFHGAPDRIHQLANQKPALKEAPKTGPAGLKLDKSSLGKEVEAYLIKLLAKETKLPASKLNRTDPFEKYGIDSIMITNLNRDLEKGFGELPKTLFFEYHNLADLTGYLVDNYGAAFEKRMGKPAISAAETPRTSSEPKDTSLGRFLPGRLSSPSFELEIAPAAKMPVAIVGVSGRYPLADDIDQFWRNLKSGLDCVTEIPKERWDYELYYTPDKNCTGKAYSKWGGFLTGVDKFDPLFFNISPKEAELIDPQERLFLETVWHTLEDAGYVRKQTNDRKIGVFVGVMYGQYQLYGAEPDLSEIGFMPSSSYASIANRVSYFFNFHGPSLAVDTMCSSSLVSIHLACKSIQNGESEMAVAGGVNITAHPNKYLQLSQGKFVSSDGKCRSFGEGGDGYVPGEGVGAVLLKPLHQAIADRDQIYAIIKSSSLNHGGRTHGYSVPNPNAQTELIIDALKKAAVDPRTISYMEAHGTGTTLGDPIEITGLTKAYQIKEKQHCAIGSVKSNIGHLESAAGIAGLTKVLLQMKYRKLVPSIHSEQLNPNINFAESPFFVQQSLSEWKRPSIITNGSAKVYPRTAGISAFGAGGANAHLILEEFLQEYPETQFEQPRIFVLSAKNRIRLQDYARKMAAFLKERRFGVTSETEQSKLPEKLQGDLLKIVAQLINIDEQFLSPQGNLDEYGFDPVLIHDFIDRINDQYRLAIHSRAFSPADTVAEIAASLLGENSDGLARFYGFGDSESKLQNDDLRENTLENICYTLQIGRESMEERLAVVVSDTAELLQKLNDYCNDPDSAEVFQGNIKDSAGKLSDIYEGKAGQEFLARMVRDSEWDKLARLWVSGVEIDWDLIYKTEKPWRISLPGYPFEQEQFWVPRNRGRISNKLHPLVHQNISTFEEVKYSSGFSGNEFFCTDYLVNREARLSGIIALETAYAAAKLAQGNFSGKFKNIAWRSDIPGNGPSDLQISLYPVSSGSLFEIRVTQNDNSVILSQGELISSGQNDGLIKEIKDIGTIKSRLQRVLGRQDFYRELNEKGISYRDGYQCVKEISCNDDEAFTYLEVPLLQGNSKQEFDLNPALLEGAMQAVLFLIHNRPSSLGPEVSPYFRLAEADVKKPLRQSCYLHVIRETKKISAPEFEIVYLAEDGSVFVILKGLTYDQDNSGRALTYQVESPTGFDTAQTQRQLSDDLRGLAVSLVKMSPEKMALNESFGSYGFESVAIKELADQIGRKYRINISPAILFDYDTIQKLEHYLITQFGAEVNAFYHQNLRTPGAVFPAQVEKSKPFLQPLSPKLLGIRRYTSEVEHEAIAIIGMSGLFPGSRDLHEFWEYLRAETDLITEVPEERWNWREFHADYSEGKYATKSKWGGFIPEVDKFDPRFFNISPLEAEMMDPQQRLFLETVWKTFEDSGYKPSEFSGKKVGLFVGVQFSDYRYLLADQGELNAQMGLGNEHSILVNRISYLLNLRGPSEPYNTACSSSLVAIHRAIQSIRNGESQMAIAGGVSLMLSPYSMISADQMGILSPDGRCKTFDKNANGYVKGEGVGALLLKPFQKALEDRDHIYAVIKGSAVNHGGKASSLTAPNSLAQSELLVSAYREAGFSPDTISYLELHGTGTQLGDPIEIEGIKNAFKELAAGGTLENNYCGLGSVKTNIGHLEPASGIAGIIKLILSMRHKQLPGILHLKELNPYINLDNTPFYIVKRTSEWGQLRDKNGQSIPRRAGVSSFGFGGANAHIILEEYERPLADSQVNQDQKEQIVVLSAKNKERLTEYASRLVKFMEKNEESDGESPTLQDIAFTLQVGREELNERFACVAESKKDLLVKLKSYIEGKPLAGVYTGSVKANPERSQGRNSNPMIGDTDLNQPAQVWTQGEPVDWMALHKNGAPRRIPLPTYPFARERYWALDPLKNEAPINKSEMVETGRIITEDIPAADSQAGSIEGILREIFAEKLKLKAEEMELDQNFAEYGVDSIISSLIIQIIQERLGLELPVTALTEYPTLGQLMEYITREHRPKKEVPVKRIPEAKVLQHKQSQLPPELIPLNNRGGQLKSFWVHGGPGYAAFFNNLSSALGTDYPFYAFQAKGYDGKEMPRDFDDMISHYIDCIRMVQPQGPYFIGGYSSGGFLAYEMARRLSEKGQSIGRLFMLDTLPGTKAALQRIRVWNEKNPEFILIMMANEFSNARKTGKAVFTKQDLMGIPNNMQVAHIAKMVKEKGASVLTVDELYNYMTGSIKLNEYIEIFYDNYQPQPYSGSNVVYFKAVKGFIGASDWMGYSNEDVYGGYNYIKPWRELVKKDLDVVEVPSDHFTILDDASLQVVVKKVKDILNSK